MLTIFFGEKKLPTGWKCPECLTIFAPHVDRCQDCCGPVTYDFSK